MRSAAAPTKALLHGGISGTISESSDSQYDTYYCSNLDVPNNSLREIMKTLLQVKTQRRIFDRVIFLISDDVTEIHQGLTYQSRADVEEQLSTFAVTAITDNTIEVQLTKRASDAFFGKVRFLFTVTPESDGHRIKFETFFTTAAKLPPGIDNTALVKDINDRAMGHLHRLIKDPQSFILKEAIRENIRDISNSTTNKVYTVTVSINATPAHVQSVLTDFDHYDTLHPRLARSTTNPQQLIQKLGQAGDMTFNIAESSPAKITFKSSASWTKIASYIVNNCSMILDWQPVSGGTKLTFTYAITHNSWAGYAVSLASGGVSKRIIENSSQEFMATFLRHAMEQIAARNGRTLGAATDNAALVTAALRGMTLHAAPAAAAAASAAAEQVDDTLQYSFS